MAKKQKRPAARPAKLLAHHHTGKLRAHTHTSYGSLALILLLAFAPLLFVSRSVAADSTSGGDSEGVYAVVAAPVPTTAPVITSPTNNTVFKSTGTITVSGQCPANTLIEIFRNQVMSGATLCRSGAFSVPLNLFIGSNSLVARAYNANDIPGPDSVPVSVLNQPAGIQLQGTNVLNASGIPADQLYVTGTIYYRGAETGQTTSWPLTVSGGLAPYAVSIGWGDGKTDLISRITPGQFTPTHRYTHAPSSGYDTIVVQVSDQTGQTAYLQLIALVSGNTASGVGRVVGGGYNSFGTIRLAWQLLLIAVLVVASFWFGERREVKLFKKGRVA